MKKFLATILVLTSLLSSISLLANAQENSSDLNLYTNHKECIEKNLPMCNKALDICLSYAAKNHNNHDICLDWLGLCLESCCYYQYSLDHRFTIWAKESLNTIVKYLGYCGFVYGLVHYRVPIFNGIERIFHSLIK